MIWFTLYIYKTDTVLFNKRSFETLEIALCHRGRNVGGGIISLYTVYMFFSVYVCENAAILTFSSIKFISDANDVLFWYKRCSHEINMQIEHNINMVMFHRTVIENYFNISKKVWFFEYYMVIIMVRAWSNRQSGFLGFDLAGSRL